MLKKFIVYLFLSILCGTLKAQNDKIVEFLADHQDNVTKVVWMPVTWPDSLLGFNIKVSKDSVNWKKLNRDIIQPYVEKDKDASNFIFGNNQIALDFKNHADSLISVDKLDEITFKNFKNEIFADEEKLKGLGFIFTFNLNAFIYSGFGFIDYVNRYKESHYYGVFPVFSNSNSQLPAFIYNKSGKKDDLKLTFQTEFKRKGKSKIQIIWKFDGDRFSDLNYKGFNLYKSEYGKIRKINDDFIFLLNKDNPAFFTHEDTLSSSPVKYILESFSYLEFTGTSVEAELKPTDLIVDISPPDIDLINSGINEDGQGIIIKWDNNNISDNVNYIIERKTSKTDFSVVDSINSTESSYTDFPDRENQYYYYRIAVYPKIGFPVYSNTFLTFFEKSHIPPTPVSLNGKFIQEGSRRYIMLTWNPVNYENLQGYMLYHGYTEDQLGYEQATGIIDSSSVIYEIYKTRSTNHYFAIRAVDNKDNQSKMSGIVYIKTPSSKIPPINIYPFSKEGNTTILNWEYPDDIADLSGFNIYLNGQLLTTVDAQVRAWQSNELQPGSYQFSIEAITESNVSSGISQARNFNFN